MREDAPINVKGWQPENYGHEYFGPVTLTQGAGAVAQHRVGAADAGGHAARRWCAPRTGSASPRKLEPNASIALGTSEVSLLELVGAYAPFANGGFAVIAARDRAHHRRRRQGALQRATRSRSAASSTRATSRMMNAMMQETLIIGTARKAAAAGWPAAGKTGTSQDFRDAWFVGYTAHLVTGVWLGNDDGTPTKKVTGGGLPVEIWSRFMRAAHQGVPVARAARHGAVGCCRPVRQQRARPDRDSLRPPRRRRRVGPSAATAQRGGLDGWLLDNLFGRALNAVLDAARAQPRVASHSTRVAQPITATPAASGQALLPEQNNRPPRRHSAAALCCTKPSSEEAAPARSGNGVIAPAIACGSTMPRPAR